VPGPAGSPDRVVGRRTCADHGAEETLLASNARWYFTPPTDRKDCGAGCGCHSADGRGKAALGSNAAVASALADDLSTCVALIEIVQGCNLACPTCFADAPRVPSQGIVPLAEFKRRVEGAVRRKGEDLEILMLSGGEPTIHPELIEILGWLKGYPSVQYVMLNTNGVQLAGNPDLALKIGEIFPRPKGGLQVYLQFDGPGLAGQRELRGYDLRALRLKAIRNLSAAKVPVTLAMTVNALNRDTLWQTVEVALAHEWVHGVALQPEFSSGRGPQAGDRLTAACVIDGLIAQSGGVLTESSITPLPCGHPNCTFIGYVLKRVDGSVTPVFDQLPMAQLQRFLGDSLHYRLDELVACGCDRSELGTVLHALEGGIGKMTLDARTIEVIEQLKAGGRLVRIVVKPFMGVETYDARRSGMCCTHVLTPAGELQSFCEYYGDWPKVGAS
jgi:uncharacterized radical SAM superfamily Fe-S cluster-containing enzyme